MVASGAFTPRSISGLALWLDASDTASTYTTDAGPVTAVSSPLDISGCVGWWDSSDLSSMKQNSDGTGSVAAGDPVGYWADKSTTGAHVTGSGTARPTLSATGFNSRQALVFNGSTTNLSRASYTATNSLSGLTRIAVCAHTTNTTGALSRVFDGGSDFFLFMNGSARSYVSNGTSHVSFLISGSNVLPAGLYADVYSNSAISLYSSGAAIVGTVSGTIPATTGGGTPSIHIGSNVGANFFWNGPIAEYIIFNRALSRSELARVEAYLAQRWGISGVHAQATASSDPVGYWADKSGNARHATQSTAASRPTISATALNGKKQIALTSTQGNCLTTQSLTLDAPYSLIAVVSSSARRIGVFAGSSVGSNTQYGDGSATFSGAYYGAIRVAGAVYGSAPIAAGRAQVFSAVASSGSLPSSLSMFSDGIGGTAAVVYAGAAPSNTLGGPLQVGSSSTSSWGGTICEMIAYSKALSTAERQRLERYLAAKYGITLAPQVSNADAQDWINRVYANGGSVSASTASAVNTLCDSLDAASLRDRFYRLNLFCGTGLNACLVPLYRGPSLSGTQYGNTTDTNVGPFVSGDYNETGVGGGLLGNGSSKYLNTGLTVSDIGTAASGHMSVYHGLSSGVNVNRYYMGANDATTGNRFYFGTDSFSTASALGIYGGVQGASQSLAANGHGPAGHRILSRETDSLLTHYHNGSVVATNTTGIATAVSNAAFAVFAVNRNGTVDRWHNSWISAYSIGLGLNSTQASAYRSILQTFQTALGRNV